MGRYFPARIRTIVRVLVRIMAMETSALQVEGNDNTVNYSRGPCYKNIVNDLWWFEWVPGAVPVN